MHQSINRGRIVLYGFLAMVILAIFVIGGIIGYVIIGEKILNARYRPLMKVSFPFRIAAAFSR